MNNLNVDSWKYFMLSNIFTFKKGLCSNAPDLDDGFDIPYIGAKKSENGVMKWVLKNSELTSKGNCISFICQGEGSNGYNNYFDIDTIQTTSNVLGYNENLNVNNGLFIVTILDLEKLKWSFGRGRAPKLLETKIKLPTDKNGELDWYFMENYIKKLRESERDNSILDHPFDLKKNIHLDVKTWNYFKVKDIFKKLKIKKHSQIPEEEGTIPFISSTSLNNGVTHYSNIKDIEGNCITVSTNGNCFDSFYQKKPISVSTDVEVLYCDNLNGFNAIFISTLLNLETYRWSYGRKPKNNAVWETKIKLPVNKNGSPDWKYMESYIKQLKCSKFL